MSDENEAARLNALAGHGIMDTAPEEAFDRLTSLAAELFDAPMALVSLVDNDRQWFKSRHGIEAPSTPRSWAFCAHAIELEPSAVMVVEDARLDQRFKANPLVVGDPNIRFYAGAVLTDADGFNIGTLCVLDSQSRPTPPDQDLRRLKTLAGMVVAELELRRTKRLVADQQRLLQMAEHISGVGHWRYRLVDSAVTWSDQTYAIHGVTRETFDPNLGDAVDLVVDEDRPHLLERMDNAITAGETYEIEVGVRRADGEVRSVIYKAECLFDEQGNVEALYGMAKDITDQKKAIAALAESEAKHRAFVENTSDLVIYASLDGPMVYVSPSSRAYGYEPEDLIGRAGVEYVHADDRKRFLAHLTAVVSGHAIDPAEDRQVRYRCKDGQYRWLEGNPQLIRDEAGRPLKLLNTFRDVTEQRRLRDIEVEQTRFERLAKEVAGVGYWRMDAKTQALTWSEQMFLVYGLQPGAEPALEQAMAMTHPDDRGGGADRLQRALSTGQGWRGDVTRIIRPDGQMRYVEGRGVSEHDDKGTITAIVGTLIDITDHKTLEAQLRQARVEAEAAATAKGEFLANMSHEIRTPLTSIIGFTSLATEQADLTGLSRVFVERVGDASRALLCTVNDILDFSKLEAGQVSFEPQPTSIAKLSKATLELFTPQAGAKDIELSLTGDIGGDDLTLLVDPDRIRQILLNLVSNAVKFTDVGGVTLNMTYDDEAGELAVEVIDTGAGIPADKLDLLFQRFSQVNGSTTRSVGGTGLGLAICKGLVDAMGGEIGVDSRPGHGSRFWFRIPARKAQLIQASLGPNATMPTFAGVRVLVVDDHAANRDLARLFLTGVGAEIAEATDGEEAVRMASEWPFDVILMDLRMPRLDGRAALARIRAEFGPNDATPILAFTADADAEMTAKLMAHGFQDVVSKPIEPGALISAVSRATSFAFEPETQERTDAG